MDTRTRMRRRAQFGTARGVRLACALALTLLAACGGPNQSDLDDITGGSNSTKKPTSTRTFTPVPTATETPTPSPTSTPEPAQAIQFIGASIAPIGVRGSGLPEQSVLQFRVVDAELRPIRGLQINFSLSTQSIGGEIVSPASAVSDADGKVLTVLSSGTRSTALRVIAAVSVNPTVAVQSSQVGIVGAPPSAAHFSIAAQYLNISGRVRLGIRDRISVYVNDRFGNAVPQDTTVSFMTNGASVVAPTPTGVDGEATANLISEGGVLPPDGIVTVLASTRGEEAFVDENGNGIYDDGESFTDVAEPFIDVNGNGRYDADNPYERFIDTNSNGLWDSAQSPGSWDSNALIWDVIPVTFSASTRAQLLTAEEYDAIRDELRTNFNQPTTPFEIPKTGSETFFLVVRDIDSNSIVGGSTVEINPSVGTELIGLDSFSIPDAETFGDLISGVNVFSFTIKDATEDSVTPTPASSSTPGARVRGVSETQPDGSVVVGVSVSILSADLPAGGNNSLTVSRKGYVLARPTPTPTLTNTPAPTSSPTLSPTGTLSPTATWTPEPAQSIQFLGATLSSIGVRGSGLPEQSQLQFRVVDSQARPINGVRVNFSLSGQSLGGESVSPISTLSGADGTVTAVLSSGTRTTTVRILATVNQDPPVTVQSTQVAIVGAPPSAPHFSIAGEFKNISGRVTFGLRDTITAYVNDRFGNAVPPGTVVSFITNGASVVDPRPTGVTGEATAILLSEGALDSQPNGVPPDGIVRVLASTRGEEPFTDSNGNGVYDTGEAFQDVAEPFIDVNGNGQYDPNNPYERFVDVNHNGLWDAAQGAGTWNNDAIIWDTIPVTFSAQTQVQLLTADEFAAIGGNILDNFSQPTPTLEIPALGTQSFVLLVRDLDSQPIVGGSEVSISTGGAVRLLGPDSWTIPDAETFGTLANGVNVFFFSVADNPSSNERPFTYITASVTSEDLPAGGNLSVSITRTGEIIFPPTPTITPTSTRSPTPTETPLPEAAHIQLGLFTNQAGVNGDGSLSAVISALVTYGDGSVIPNDVPVQFRLVAPVPAGVSVTSPGLVGRAAPCTLSFPVQAQPGDALSCLKYNANRQGQTVTVEAIVQTPSGPLSDQQTIVLPDLRTATPTFTPTSTSTSTRTATATPTPAAAHIQVALFSNQASANGDGTLSSVISALVTDSTGAVVGNGVSVQFSLLVPVAGVSVTSPGLVGGAAPCSLGFAVQPQPGDALSCIKYDTARQGQTVTVVATVQTPNGPLTDSQLITLPDLRTATPTHTSTPTGTSTATITPTPTPGAAHIEVGLFVNQASVNGDGTLSSVISALVTDSTGAVVGNGVPVSFRIVNTPVPSGVSVTSPGLVGAAAPCTLSFAVQAQPGDALSCIKYNAARQGQSVTIEATVQSPSGPLTDTQTIILPDLRTNTPTQTPSFTPTSTPTRTSTPTPAAAHIEVGLFVEQASTNGDGTLSTVISALVTDATGAVVGNGVPVSFRIVNTPVPSGISVTSPGLVGGAVPCTLSFTVQSQPGDALSCIKYNAARQGQSVTIEATVQTPGGPLSDTQTITLPDLRTSTPTRTATSTQTPTLTPTSTPSRTPTPTPAAAHIKVALFLNQASNNGDGTLSSVISALVTDATGAVVANGIPVTFSIGSPVPGVSVTSPGLVGAAAPCSLSFPVQAQPGDALSCIKYDMARQGESITIIASVQAPGGALTDMATIKLPDLRTATPTQTATATRTATITPTPTAPPTATATASPLPTASAASIVLAQFVGQSCDNEDGTAITVLSAVVTDNNGNAVPDNIPVFFAPTVPNPGIAVTLESLTGKPAPCSLACISATAQPGDAIGCIKFDLALIDTEVTIRASVPVPVGTPLSATSTIKLPAP